MAAVDASRYQSVLSSQQQVIDRLSTEALQYQRVIGEAVEAATCYQWLWQHGEQQQLSTQASATQLFGELANQASLEHDELTKELGKTEANLEIEVSNNRRIMLGNQDAVALLEWETNHANMTSH